MKRVNTVRWLPAALLLLAAGVMAARAGDLAIQLFDTTGRLTFNRTNTVETYLVEWSSSPAGVWRSGHPGGGVASTPGVDGVATTTVSVAGSGLASAFFRVVVATNTYLVIDLSGGTGAESYPVTYLDAVPPGGWTDVFKTTKLVLRKIPAGTFTMGSPSGEIGREPYWPGSETQHQVMLTQDFYIGVFEVTQRQWELVMGDKPSRFNNASYYETRPVEMVSYYDIRENQDSSDDPAVDWPANSAVNATSFMGKLRAKTGLTGFDLPTESQWEYACRAGTTTALNSGQNLTNPSDNDPQMNIVGRYWYNGGSDSSWDCDPSKGTATVGNYVANRWGLYDMHGNVWEWCLDWYETYPGTVTDPPGASLGLHRVFRGGSFGSFASFSRSAIRYRNGPSYQDVYVGFRACCAPPGQP